MSKQESTPTDDVGFTDIVTIPVLFTRVVSSEMPSCPLFQLAKLPEPCFQENSPGTFFGMYSKCSPYRCSP